LYLANSLADMTSYDITTPPIGEEFLEIIN